MVAVAVLGGGVGGLTAAHELACRGFEVTLYEARTGGSLAENLGGKARSQYWTKDGQGPFPGEHGFRFFPGFYEQVPETMRRIPLDASMIDPREAADGAPISGPTVIDRLVTVHHMAIARKDEPLTLIARRQPRQVSDIRGLLDFYFSGLGVPPEDMTRLWLKLFAFYASCDERREAWDRISFFEYVGAQRMSPRTQRMLQNLPKALVAMDAKQGSARTLANTLFLMLTDQFKRDGGDRLLDGPTTETWIAPWVAWLERLGVRFRCGQRLTRLELDRTQGRIQRAYFGDEAIRADYYVLALPLEEAVPIMRRDLAGASEAIERFRGVVPDEVLGWMVGVQLYLSEDRSIAPGHIALPDAPWGVTAISQAQFWQMNPSWPFKGILSIDVTNWEEPGDLKKKPAHRSSRREIIDELLYQLHTAKDLTGASLISDQPFATHIDDDLVFSSELVAENHSRLLIHPPGFWSQRPPAASGISNLVLAADYVKNNMDLATMEGANEAARAAANEILLRERPGARPCPIVHHLHAAEPSWLKELKALDAERYHRRRPSPTDAIKLVMQALPRLGDPWQRVPGAEALWRRLLKS